MEVQESEREISQVHAKLLAPDDPVQLNNLVFLIFHSHFITILYEKKGSEIITKPPPSQPHSKSRGLYTSGTEEPYESIES